MPHQTLLLLHGGIHEAMDADRFWTATGVLDALRAGGMEVLAPDRLVAPRSWAEDADHVADLISASVDGPLVVVGGSNGCSTAVRLAVGRPGLAAGLVLCWPATVGSERSSGSSLQDRMSETVGPIRAAELLAGATLRGVDDHELAALDLPVAVMAAEPENPIHRRETVDRLRRLMPESKAFEPMPEPLVAGFDPQRFASVLVGWVGAVAF